MNAQVLAKNASSPELSRAIVAALANAGEISAWISNHHPSEIMESRNHRLAAPYFAICLEHREAALLLIANDMRGSAFALWRPTYESYMRGHWALNVASEEDFKNIAKNKALPKFDTIIKSLDSKSKNSMFAKTKAKMWEPMSDFAHGGLTLLSRWSSPEGIGSNHPDDETLDLILRLNTYALLAAMGVNYMAGEHGALEEVFVDKVTALLPAIRTMP
jgi:hypothetical protein